MTELHKRTGISMKTLSLFANKRTDGVQYRTLEKVSRALGVELEDLIMRSDDVYDIGVFIDCQ